MFRWAGLLQFPSFLAALLALCPPPLAAGQTDLSVSFYGAFNRATAGNNTQQSPANQAGGLLELRHIANPVLGFEATYSVNRSNQTYSNPPVACPLASFACSWSTESVSANAHELTADWIPSLHLAHLRAFAVLGAGLLVDVPAENQAPVTTTSTGCLVCASGPGVTTSRSPTRTSTRPVYVYGAGLDWGLFGHAGLRLQYRGNLYPAPNLTTFFSSTDAFTHSAEPMMGAWFRF